MKSGKWSRDKSGRKRIKRKVNFLKKISKDFFEEFLTKKELSEGGG